MRYQLYDTYELHDYYKMYMSNYIMFLIADYWTRFESTTA